MSSATAWSSLSWKRLVTVLTIAGTLLVLYDIAIGWVFPVLGNPGFDIKPGSVADTIEVRSVDPGSAAQRAGLQAGDIIDVTSLDWRNRSALPEGFARNVAGTSFTLPVLRESSTRTIHFQVPAALLGANGTARLLLAIAVLWMLAFAFAIGRARPDDPNARSICSVLLAYSLAWALWNFTCSVEPLNIIANVLGLPGYVLSATLFALFALRFVGNIRWRRVARLITCSLFVVSVVLTTTLVVGILVGRPNPIRIAMLPSTGIWFAESYHFVVARSFALLCGVWAIASSRGGDRQRIAWATAAIAPSYLTTLIVQPLFLLGAVDFSLYESLVDVTLFLAPIGFTYAALSRRFLDIGFVVNRAAVFTGVSVILLGAFVLVEWLLTDWLSATSHATNVLVSGGVALTLGLSIRFVHQRVDHVVDRVFFRKRHENEEAIRATAREAPYITDPDILLRRATESLEHHTDATSVDIVLRYDENDPAIVRLRAQPHVLDLRGLETELQGELGFPMTARGQFLGVVVLGAQHSGEAFAPDEVSAISQLAASLGSALDAFANRNGEGENHVAASIDALRGELASAVTALRQEILALRNS